MPRRKLLARVPGPPEVEGDPPLRSGPPEGACRPGAASVCAALALLFAAGAYGADATAPDPSAVLSKIVARLSAQARCSPQDWAEFGQESVTWGQHLKTAGQAVPEGPVRDALRAVDLGAASDPKAADWPKMRSELEDLLKKR